jgi:hypothetical protein
MKFTAGLHHPFRHPQKDPFPPMHGYFNIFFAALVAHSAHPPAKTLERIVSEMTDLSPVVSAGEIAWLGFTVTATQIAAARRDFALSYGSCSFLEPLEDARTLKWL